MLPDYSSWQVEAVAEAAVRYAESLKEGAREYEDESAEEADEGAEWYIRDTITSGDISHAWSLVRAAVRAAPDETLNVHAAGLLEELVQTRGAECIDLIEQEARRDDRFRWALGQIWIFDAPYPDEIVQRFVAASDGAIQPLRSDDGGAGCAT